MDLPLVLTGRVVTFDEDQPVLDDGAVYIGADELIAAVQPRKDAGARRASTAPASVRTGGAIYPGLIDLHGHIAYNGLPLWSPPGRIKPYTSRYQWPGDQSYEGMISDPANALGALAGKAHLKYLETKAVVGGTTAIQGTAKTGRPYEGWLVRNIEHETFQTKKKTVYVSALPLRDEAAYKSQAAAPQGQAGLRLPPVRGHGPQAHRRVHDDEHRALPRPGPGGHPLHGAREAPTTTSGRRSAARSCGRRSPTCGSTRDHRRPRRARRGRAHLPGRRLVALGLEEPPRRAEGRRHVEPRRTSTAS